MIVSWLLAVDSRRHVISFLVIQILMQWVQQNYFIGISGNTMVFPESIVSDRGRQFVAKFWHAICERAETKLLFSTAWHPETDGQTERFNVILECYLRAYCNYQQDDWVDWLPSAEYNANNTESETTKVTPFFANSAQHPRSAITPYHQSSTSASGYSKIQVNSGSKLVDQMNQLNDSLRVNMRTAEAFDEKFADRHRSSAPGYQVGDKVSVSAQHVKTKRPCKKLDWKNSGPFAVSEKIGSHSYRLHLPDDLRSIHPIFHTSLLRPDPNNPITGQVNEPNPPSEVDKSGEDLDEVVAIVGSRRLNQKGFQYRVKYTRQDATSWQRLPDIVSGDSAKLVQASRKSNPRRIKPREIEYAEAIADASLG